MGRHGSRSEEQPSDLGYSSDVRNPQPLAGRWWDEAPAAARPPRRPVEHWWDDAPVPPPVVVASADGRTPAVTFEPGRDPFSAGGVFAPAGGRDGEPSVVVHASPDAAVARQGRTPRRRPVSPAVVPLRTDAGPDTGSLVRPYVPALDAAVAAAGAAPVTATMVVTETDATAGSWSAPEPVRPSRRAGGPLDLIIETAEPVAASDDVAAPRSVPVAPRPVGEWSAPWATDAPTASGASGSLFQPRGAGGQAPADPWVTPAEQSLPSRKALRARERAGRGPQRSGGPRLRVAELEGTELAGRDLAARSTGRRLAKSGVLAVTAVGVVAASAPNAFSALGLHLPAHEVGPGARTALVGLAGTGALTSPQASLSLPATAVDDSNLAAIKVEAQQRLADGQAASRAAAARAAVAATGAGRTLVDVARDQVRAEAARKAAIADRVSRNVLRDPRSYARLLLSERGWGDSQFTCLNLLWNRESGWNYQAYNPSSGAYGIPQALPGSKMASVAPDWRTNAATQIRWGLNYISSVYGTPCGAWGHSQATGWY